MVNNYLLSLKASTARTLLLILALGISVFTTVAQTVTVPAGNPPGGTNWKPLGVFFGYERSVMTYNPTELGIPGNRFITECAFYLESTNTPTPCTYNVKIYMKEVASATLTAGTYPSLNTGATLVFDGMLDPSYFSTPGTWITLPFQNCFIYTSSANSLMVLVEANYGSSVTTACDPQPQNGWYPEGTSNAVLFRTSTAPQASFMGWNADFSPPTYSVTPNTVRPNAQFTHIPATPCTPGALPTNAPTASSTSVCSGDVILLTLPAVPCVGGLSYQWQYSLTGAGGPFNNIAGGTNSLLSTSQSQQTHYRCVITCGGFPTTTNATLISQNNYLSCYCGATALSTADTDIGNVTFGGMDNPGGGCTPLNNNPTANKTYTDYSSVGPFNYQQGTNVPINLCQVTGNNTFFSAFFNVFIDWNADGVFDPVNERVFFGGPTSSAAPSVNGFITIPYSSALGITKMRVMLRENGNNTNPPCGTFTWGEVEDYNINITPGLTCNLTSAGSATSSLPSVCNGQTFTLDISGNTTVGSYQSWQWQASTAGAGGPWANILGASYTPYKTTQTVDTWYRCILICNAGTPTPTAVVYVPMAPPTQCYCVPPYGATCSGNYVANVTFNTLNNTTLCTSGNGPSYTQYPVSGSTTTSVTQNQTYNLSITTAGGGNAILSVWIDWNRNGVFETTEWYQPSTNNPSGSTVAVPITVPAFAGGAGLTGMRVRSRLSGNQNGAADPCLNMFSGEGEDYYITVIAYTPPNCNAPATANLNVTTTSTTPCSGTAFTLALTGLPVAVTGYNYQWQSSSNGGATWANIPGAISASLNTSQTSSLTYRVVYQCSFVPGYVNSLPRPVTNLPNFWKGVNSNWSDATNWCTAVPTINDDVLISRSQPGVSSPYYAPIVAVTDTMLSRNLTINSNDTITLYNDTLNSVNIAQNVNVNGKFILRTSVSDTCCAGTVTGTSTNATYQPFKTNVAENRLQMSYIQGDFASLPNLSSSDQVTYLLLDLDFIPTIVPASGTFKNLTVSYGWIPSTTLEFSSNDPFPTPYTVATIPVLNLAGKTTTAPNDTIMIPTSNFLWKTDSNLVVQICYDTPTGQTGMGGVPSYGFKVATNLARRTTWFASVTSSSGGLDGCQLISTSVGASSGFADARPNMKFIFGRKPKKLGVPIGGDLLVNSTGQFLSTTANLTVGDSLYNQGIVRLDSTTASVTTLLLNSGTFDMAYIYTGASNRQNSLTVGGAGITNSGTFSASNAPITISGTNLNNNGTYNGGTSTVTFTGAPIQSIGGANPITLYRLRLNKVANSNVLTLNNTALTVTDSINLLLGSIDLNQKTLTFSNGTVLWIRPGNTATTGGYLVTDNWNSRFKWSINANAGMHVIPFSKTALATGGSYIPMEINPGTENLGDVTAATVSTVPTNTPLPTGIWHINNAAGTQNSTLTVDRFWYWERSTLPTGTGTTQFALSCLYAERVTVPAMYGPGTAATTIAGGYRVQPYYTYTVGPSTFARWDNSTPASVVSFPAPGNILAPSAYRFQVNSYTWPVAFGTSNPWAISATSNPLPIELLQFTATLKGSENAPVVQLDWATASEEDNDYFTIERTTDFTSILEIDRVESLGNSSTIQKYQTIDYSPVKGMVNYYRLKQTDNNGSATFSDRWVPISIGMKDVFSINYVKGMDKLEVVFDYDGESNVDVVVTDMTGREMYRSTGFGATPGPNILAIDAKGWSQGVYMITLMDQERKVSHKIFY